MVSEFWGGAKGGATGAVRQFSVKIVLTTQFNKECSGEAVHIHNLARAFSVSSQIVNEDTNP